MSLCRYFEKGFLVRVWLIPNFETEEGLYCHTRVQDSYLVTSLKTLTLFNATERPFASQTFKLEGGDFQVILSCNI